MVVVLIKNQTEDKYIWVHIPAPPLTKYVTGDKLLNLALPPFPPLST